MVGILVEEALIARGLIDSRKSNSLNRQRWQINQGSIDYPSVQYNDIDELISDQGITYDTKRNQHNSVNLSSKSIEVDNEELFKQFKQFLQFKKLITDK